MMILYDNGKFSEVNDMQIRIKCGPISNFSLRDYGRIFIRKTNNALLIAFLLIVGLRKTVSSLLRAVCMYL
jgi:hypothetical protein